MEARLRKDGEINLIHIFGNLSYEEVDRFAEVCNQLTGQKVVFNFDGLDFVGSSGITSFFSALDSLCKASASTPKVCCLSLEFRKCFETLGEANFDYFESEYLALKSYTPVSDESRDSVGRAVGNGQAYVSEQPIGNAYPLGTTIDARPDAKTFVQRPRLDLANGDD